MEAVTDFRLDIDAEYQRWILVFATVTAVFLFCLPCYCAGLSYAPARKFAVWLSQRLPSFYTAMALFNLTFLSLVINCLPGWTLADYLMAIIQGTVTGIQHLLDCASSIAIIIAFAIVVAFKDRLAQLFGFDHKTLFRFKIRDLLSCLGPSRFIPIEIAIWKVDDLPAADPFSANNVFVEFFLGYNEPCRSRVHNNAGNGCFLKEKLQLNFDGEDQEETLYVFVRNQKIVGNSELARAELNPELVKGLLQRRAGNSEMKWNDQYFPVPIQLIPRGKLWINATTVDDEILQDSAFNLTQC